MFRASLLAIGLFASAASGQPADLVLHSGVVHTVVRDAAPAAAIAVRDGSIVAVGDDESVLALRGPDTRVIDLAGRFVCPGFNDSHVHFQKAAVIHEFDLRRVTTPEAFRAAVRDSVEGLSDRQWITGGFWGAYEPFTPDVPSVEDLTANHPMFIRSADDSTFAANRAALAAADLDPDNPQAPAVVFQRDAEGRLTGIMTGVGVLEAFRSVAPTRAGLRRRERQTLEALTVLARHGVTSISDTSDDIQFRIFERVHSAGLLTCRVHVRAPLEQWQSLEQRGITLGAGDAWLRRGAVTGHMDGTLGARTARMLGGYEDDPDNRGAWQGIMVDTAGGRDRMKLLKLIRQADTAGFQIAVHATGDEANHVLLDLIDRLRRAEGNVERRFRLGGAQVIAPEDLERMAGLRLVADVQPVQLADDLRWLEQRLGPERCARAFAFRGLADRGAVLSFGSGGPGTATSAYPIDPLLGLYAAVTRQDLDGRPEGGLHPEQRLTMTEAIRAATWGPAFASFEEKIKGTIEVGKFADLVVLSRNLLEIEPRELLDTEVHYTIAGGRLVYEKP